MAERTQTFNHIIRSIGNEKFFACDFTHAAGGSHYQTSLSHIESAFVQPVGNTDVPLVYKNQQTNSTAEGAFSSTSSGCVYVSVNNAAVYHLVAYGV